ncbi:MAG: excisionase family DNA-binding protein [Bifidobacteriaceae bacterium]|nr:excisionase family DNA-binding protein [Bifidobacteriaceae bacterium]
MTLADGPRAFRMPAGRQAIAVSIFAIYDWRMSLLIAAPDEARSATSLVEALALGGDVSVVVSGKNPVRLPVSLLRVLSAAAEAFADGKGVVVGSQDTYLTTQEAADFLGVSRPTMVKLLEAGDVPFERPNSHRRVRFGDLAVYERAERKRRRAVLDKMADDFSDLSRRPELFTATR